MNPIADVAIRNRKQGRVIKISSVGHADLVKVCSASIEIAAVGSGNTQKRLCIGAIPAVGDDVAKVILNPWLDPRHHGDVAAEVQTGRVFQANEPTFSIEET